MTAEHFLLPADVLAKIRDLAQKTDSTPLDVVKRAISELALSMSVPGLEVSSRDGHVAGILLTLDSSPKTLSAIADELGTKYHALFPVIRRMVAIGLVGRGIPVKTRSRPADTFSLTPLGLTEKQAVQFARKKKQRRDSQVRLMSGIPCTAEQAEHILSTYEDYQTVIEEPCDFNPDTIVENAGHFLNFKRG